MRKIDFASLNITSPKQRQKDRRGWSGLFPYYAGYPATFAEKIIESASLARDAVILDPWNGSGTTGLAASRNNLKSVGCDINPVMNIVANARVRIHNQ